jgi:RNA polymerase sigma-70 factor (ECF subfamily)
MDHVTGPDHVTSFAGAATGAGRDRGARLGKDLHADAAPQGARAGSRMPLEAREAMIEMIPRLRAFAISLTGNIDRADDLVQETIVRGLTHIESFQPGTNLQAWLFTILRNQFHTSYRKRKREVEDPDGTLAGALFCAPEQNGHLDLQDMSIALSKLPVEQREALLLVAAEGLSYEEAAVICDTVIGTIKSRINRARARLAELLEPDADTPSRSKRHRDGS